MYYSVKDPCEEENSGIGYQIAIAAMKSMNFSRYNSKKEAAKSIADTIYDYWGLGT